MYVCYSRSDYYVNVCMYVCMIQNILTPIINIIIISSNRSFSRYEGNFFTDVRL